MSVTIQPLHSDDSSLRSGQPKVVPLTAEQVEVALKEGGQVETGGMARVKADLYAGVDPTIGDNGIITSMTVKPVVEHKADLRAQIEGAVNSTSDAQSTQIVVADMQAGGGAAINPSGAMAGGTYVSPDVHAKDNGVQQPKSEAPKPPIIIGGV